MSDSIKGSDNHSSEQTDMSYEEARELLEDRDRENLLKLASDKNSYPEMLYFLSGDDDLKIRDLVAANPSTPLQADEVLSRDTEWSVRQTLGAKVARSLPTLPEEEETRRSAAVSILEHLIEDEEVRVRRIIAEELKATDKIPLHIVQKLARDIDEHVSTPVLHHSPLLDDEELISIVEDAATPSKICAIARRQQVSEPLAECIVETADVEAISQLLLNPSAQIREKTLDQLIAGAQDTPEWHEPLVMRPVLPFGAIMKIADFVAASLIEVLAQRNDVDDELRQDLELRVQQRLTKENSGDDQKSPEPLDVMERKLRQLHLSGNLNEDYLQHHIEQGERNVIILSLGILADIPVITSRRIFVSLSAKAIMSLGWKAGVSAPLAAKIQQTIGKIPADEWVLPNDDEDYPFAIREMQWQLALFLDQEENLQGQSDPNLEMNVS